MRAAANGAAPQRSAKIGEVPPRAAGHSIAFLGLLALDAKVDPRHQLQPTHTDIFAARFAAPELLGVSAQPRKRGVDRPKLVRTALVAVGRDHLAHLLERRSVIIELSRRVDLGGYIDDASAPQLVAQGDKARFDSLADRRFHQLRV